MNSSRQIIIVIWLPVMAVSGTCIQRCIGVRIENRFWLRTGSNWPIPSELYASNVIDSSLRFSHFPFWFSWNFALRYICVTLRWRRPSTARQHHGEEEAIWRWKMCISVLPPLLFVFVLLCSVTCELSSCWKRDLSRRWHLSLRCKKNSKISIFAKEIDKNNSKTQWLE